MTIRANLHKAMAEMTNPKRDNVAKIETRTGKSFSYSYEDLAQVLEIIEPALRKHGLELQQGLSYIDDQFIMETGVADDNETLILDQRPVFFTPAAQDNASYETQMRRYAIKIVFNLAAEDDDGKSAQETAKKPVKKGDYLDPIRDALPKYAKAVGLSVQQATENILAYIGASDMKELTEDGVPTVLEFMRDEAKAFRGE